MLQSLGVGLATVATAGESRSRHLSSSEDRLEVPVAVPDSVGLPPGVKPCRFFVRDRVARAKRWEAPVFQGDRPHLALFTDHGSEMVAMSCFLIYAMFMRMDWFPDYFHDTDNDIMGGVAEAGFFLRRSKKPLS